METKQLMIVVLVLALGALAFFFLSIVTSAEPSDFESGYNSVSAETNPAGDLEIQGQSVSYQK